VKILGSTEWKNDNARYTGASLLSRGSDYSSVLEEVPTITLKHFAKTELGDSATIAFLKIDTEGNDYKVLVGAQELLEAKTVDVIFFENNAMQSDIGASLYKTVLYLKSVGCESQYCHTYEESFSHNHLFTNVLRSRRYNAYLFGSKLLLKLTDLCGESHVFQSTATTNVVALSANSGVEKSIVQIYTAI
jgi:hypothetical protein